MADLVISLAGSGSVELTPLIWAVEYHLQIYQDSIEARGPAGDYKQRKELRILGTVRSTDDSSLRPDVGMVLKTQEGYMLEFLVSEPTDGTITVLGPILDSKGDNVLF